MDDQRTAVDRQKKFPRQTDRRIPCWYDCDHKLFLMIFPVMLHGLLDYLETAPKTRRRPTVCRSRATFVTLRPVDITDDRSFAEPAPTPKPIYRPTPNDPPWNVLVALGMWIMSVILVVAIPMFFVIPYVVSQGINYSDRDVLRQYLMTNPTAVLLQLLPIILAHVLTLLFAWFIVTKGNKYSFRETLGWKMGGFRVWHALALTVLFYLIALVMVSVFGDVENEFEVLIKSSRAAVYAVAFFATFTAPVVEEVIYRGLLFSAFRRYGVVIAVIFSTLLFTIVHVPQYSFNNTPDYATIVTLLMLSLTLTLVRASTNNLLPCIVLHTVFNGIQSALLIAEPYLRSVAPSIDPVVNPGKSFFIG